VYDALDARNPRQAIKHCNALLAKAPYPLVKALKALALERTGKHDEAAALAREVAESQTTDEVTLSTLAMVLRVQGRAEEATAAYASAVQRRPDSEELATQLFCCHMRARAYAPAQLLALRMYKGFPSPDAPLYLSWAVAALLLQADLLAPLVQEGGLAGTARTVEPAPVAAGGGEGTREADSEGNRRGDEEVKRRADGAQRTKLLQLAVAMMGREEVRNEGDLQLRLAALRRLGDTAAALSLVEQHGALFCTPIERMRARAHLLEGGGRWAEAKEAHREALISHAADDWAAWMGVVRAAIREGRAEARGEVQTLIEEVRRAAGAGAGSSGAGGGGAGKEGGAAGGGAGVGGGARVSHGVAVAGTGRGMWLASMELERALLIEGGRARDGGPSSTTSGTSDSLRTNVYAPLVDSLCAYFSRFGHKPYCSHDALAYLRILPASEAAALLARIEADVGPPPTEGSPPPISERWVSRYSCACEWRLGAGLAAAAGIAAKGEAAQGVGTLTGAVGEAAGAPGMGYESPFLLRRRLAYSWLSTHAAHSTLPPGTDARERRPADVLPLLTAQLFMAAPMTEWYYTPDAGLSIGGGLCGGEALLIGTGQVGRDGAYACASGGSESGAMGRSGEGGSPSARPPPPSPRATHVASALLAAVALRRGLATSPDNRQMALALATALNCLGAPVQVRLWVV
jgi:N-terminal acetyltransferase B complex non-catalytic subunit